MTSQCFTTDYTCVNRTTYGWQKARTLMNRLFKKWSMRRQNKRERVALKELSALDDSLLKDIGISRGDVNWASKLPSSVNASVELEIIARRRSA